LYKHPAVREVAVYGVPDAVKGEAVKAAIVLKEGATATPEDIIEFCRANLAVYKAPAYVDFIKDLPRNPTGKILKRVLKGQ
jgi:acyl-CoA synthetase (AMP-forming)/AMP-acid ligase II